jgi:UDP-N-acetylmuramoyl-tripeptide--D-alanyl-D-alanine ligase
MINSLKQLAIQCGFEYVGDDVSIDKISISSNEIGDNTLFVAIVANRDGHEFIPSAIANGAKAILVSQKQTDINIPQIICKNTIKGLRKLAEVRRQSLTMPIIALTGTCGKTSVKEMIVALLSDYNVHSTKGNFNNYLGVPMTVLEISNNADFAVIETGTSVIGEIKAAADIVQPDVAVITNIGASHLENLKTLDGVMQEKGELLKSVKSNGYSIINIDDIRLKEFAKQLDSKTITCSMNDNKADIHLVKYIASEDGYDVRVSIFGNEYSYILNVSGLHNITNSMLAIAVLVSLDLKTKDFLQNTQKITSYKGRFSTRKISDKLTLVDDTYNASAPSVKSAIEDLAMFNGKKILVLTSMRELGDLAKEYHKQMGQWITNAKLDNVLLYGENDLLEIALAEIKNTNVKIYADKNNLNNDLQSLLRASQEQNTKLVVKGARSFKMEEIIQKIIS